MPTLITEDGSAWPSTVNKPTSGADNHGYLLSETIQKAINRLAFIRLRMDNGFEHPIRVGAKATMAALTGMVAGDMYYASDVERLYRWQLGAYSAQFTTDGDNVVAGSTGYWVRANLGGMNLRRAVAALPNSATITTFDTSFDEITGLTMAIGPVKAGDILEAYAGFMFESYSGSAGNVTAKLQYDDGVSPVDIPGSSRVTHSSVVCPTFNLFGRYTIPADKATASVKIMAKVNSGTQANVNYDTTLGYSQSAWARVMVP